MATTILPGRRTQSSAAVLCSQHATDDRLDIECLHIPKPTASSKHRVKSRSTPSGKMRSSRKKAKKRSIKRDYVDSYRQELFHSSAPRPNNVIDVASLSRLSSRWSAEVERREGLADYMNEDISRLRQLWRRFRRRMKQERKDAIEQQEAVDQTLQAEEQRKEWGGNTLIDEPLLLVDSQAENSRYELVLTKNLSSEEEELHIDGGFWEFLHLYKKPKDDADTASTSDNTSLADDFSLHSATSMRSYQSWQSHETVRVKNFSGTLALLREHFEGMDDPWLAAQRGDIDALERRWRYRHDWTLEDEHGNTPLYYACQSGGAHDLRVVLFLLQEWPSTQHIPESLMKRCIEDAANHYVAALLNDPSQAELIIENFEEVSSEETREDAVDHIERRFGYLYGIEI